MLLHAMTAMMRDRWYRLKKAKENGQSTGELATMAAVLILTAAGVVAAIKFKVAEKIGIIEGE